MKLEEGQTAEENHTPFFTPMQKDFHPLNKLQSTSQLQIIGSLHLLVACLSNLNFSREKSLENGDVQPFLSCKTKLVACVICLCSFAHLRAKIILNICFDSKVVYGILG